MTRLPALLLALLPGPLLATDPPAPACTVRVVMATAGGSGTVVGSDGGRSLVLTNKHVVAGQPASCKVEAGGERYPATVHATDPVADLALLAVAAALPAVELAERSPPAGTPLRQWGRDQNWNTYPAYKEGAAVGVAGTADGVPVWETTIPAFSGDSGAGVFDASGKLVAVCWGGCAGRQCCVGLAEVRRFLATVAGKAAGSSPAWVADYNAARAEAEKSGKRLVVLFTDPKTCVPCRRLEAGALADPSVLSVLSACVCCRVDVGTDAGRAVVAHFGRAGDRVSAWPTVKAYGLGLVKLADRTGDMTPAELLGLLR